MDEINGDNPYAATSAENRGAGIESGGVPPYRLFTPSGVAIASFLGSCVAGGVVLAINFWQVGKSGNAVAIIVGSVIALLALGSLFAFVPALETTPNALVGVAQATLMFFASQVMQGHMLEDHLRRGGDTWSAWWGAGIGCLTGVVLAGALLGLLYLIVVVGGEDFLEVLQEL